MFDSVFQSVGHIIILYSITTLLWEYYYSLYPIIRSSAGRHTLKPSNASLVARAKKQDGDDKSTGAHIIIESPVFVCSTKT